MIARLLTPGQERVLRELARGGELHFNGRATILCRRGRCLRAVRRGNVSVLQWLGFIRDGGLTLAGWAFLASELGDLA